MRGNVYRRTNYQQRIYQGAVHSRNTKGQGVADMIPGAQLVNPDSNLWRVFIYKTSIIQTELHESYSKTLFEKVNFRRNEIIIRTQKEKGCFKSTQNGSTNGKWPIPFPSTALTRSRVR